MIVALGLPINVAAIILGCILSMLLSVFNALGPISIPTPPTMALTEFFHADTVACIHPLPLSWYLISSVCVYLCSCMHIMSILCSTADAVSSGSWPILSKVLTLNVAICIVCLHFSSFLLFELCSWFFKHWGQGSNLSRMCPPFLLAWRVMWFMYVVWVWVMVIFQWLFLFSSIEATLIDDSSSSPIELMILSIEPQDSYVQDQVRHCVWPSEGLFAYLYVHHAASHVYVKKKCVWGAFLFL